LEIKYMAIEVNKKPKENTNAMLRRFSRKVQLSGVLLEARKSRFKQRKKSKNLRKKEAVYKEQKRKEIEKKKKLGLL